MLLKMFAFALFQRGYIYTPDFSVSFRFVQAATALTVQWFSDRSIYSSGLALEFKAGFVVEFKDVLL